MNEDQGLDVPGVPDGIGSLQILQAGDVIPGDTITLSLEDAAQLIFQQQGIQGDGEGRIQPGTYQIIAQPFASGENNQISVIQAGSSDQIQGYEFGGQSVYLQQPNGEVDQTCARIIQLSDTYPNSTGLSDQSHTIMSVVQQDTEEFTEQTELQVNQKVLEKNTENALQTEVPVNQAVFEMINHPVSETEEDSTMQQDEISDMEEQIEIQEPGSSTPQDVTMCADEEDETGSKLEGIKIEQLEETRDTASTMHSEETENQKSVPTQTEQTQEEAEQTVNKQVQQQTVKKENLAIKAKLVKKPDLSKPIKVTDHMEVIVGGKKCLLKMNADTGQLCAYPLISSSTSGKRRGRPKKTDGQNKVDLAVDSDQANSAIEGLLELSNTGPDGIRRSSRTRKKASSLQDYEMLDVSSDDDAAADNAEDEVLPTGAIRKRKISLQIKDTLATPPVAFAGVKKGRGRPRRYPRPEDTPTHSQIPAMIIPSGDGQSIMMAPIQGLSNLEAFQEQVRNMQIFQQHKSETVDDGTQFLNTPALTRKPEYVSEDDPIPMNDVNPQAAEDDIENSLDNKEYIINTISTADFTTTPASLTANNIAGVGEIPSTDTVTVDFEEKGTDGSQPTIIQIPESLLSMFIQKKDPQKIGLKASNTQLEKFKCTKCEFQGYYEQQYQRHIVNHVDDVIKCKCCPFVAFEKEDILSHFKQTHPRCICTVCDHMAEHAYIIKRHMMRHNQIGCKCDLCGKVYKDQYVLKMHVKMVHLPAEVLFECTVCSKKFTRKAHLKRHLRIHDPEKPFKCPHCPYRGCERSDISKHLLIHEEPKHICDVCGKAFRHLKNKELHMKRHSGQRDYKCGVCDFYGYTFTDIRKHIERKHTDTKAYICDKCGSAFKSEFHLREHRSQQCDVFMIEQALAIATTDGGTSQATIQIPSNYSLDGHHIQIDGQNMVIDNSGQITIENVNLTEDGMTLTADQLQAVVSQAQITDSHQHHQLIQDIGVDHSQYTSVTSDRVHGLPGDDADLPEDDGVLEADMVGEDTDMNEQMDIIDEEEEDIVDTVGDNTPSEHILEMVTDFDSSCKPLSRCLIQPI